MRVTASVLALVLAGSGPASAQVWEPYVSLQDTFEVNFPGEPAVTETTWTTALDYVVPARVYSADRGDEHYSVTVADYSNLEEQGIARSKTCEDGNQQCRETTNAALGSGYWMHDERGAIVYATFRLIQKAEEVTQLAWEWQDMVEGHVMNLTNADGSRTFAYITMHEHKLYIMEGTVPKGRPEPGLFQQSLGWIDGEGNPVRYETIYSNSYHALGIYPKPGSGGGGGDGGAGAPAPAPADR